MNQATSALMSQITALERQVNTLAKRLPTVTDKVQKNLVISQMQALNNKTSDLRVQAANVNPGDIITDARLPTSPSNPSLMMYLPSGLLAGLLIGVVIAILLDRTDKRVRTAQDVERILDLPVLLDVPAKRGRDALGLLPARSRTGQSFHELAHVLSATLGHGNHVLLVTGASPGRGGGVVAANLAAALARTGSNALLVCADLHASVAGDLLGMQEGPGLSELLLGWANLRDVVRRTHGTPTLSCITAGGSADSAAELVQREQMARLIGSLREKLRFTVIEAPSTELGADAQALADLADAALVVVETPRARYDQVRDGVRRIDRMGAAVMGAVVLPTQDGHLPPTPPAPSLPAHAPAHFPKGDRQRALNEPPTVVDMVGGADEQPRKGRRHKPDPLSASERDREHGKAADEVEGSADDTAVHPKVTWT